MQIHKMSLISINMGIMFLYRVDKTQLTNTPLTRESTSKVLGEDNFVDAKIAAIGPMRCQRWALPFGQESDPRGGSSFGPRGIPR
jgi:hypothetical protein